MIKSFRIFIVIFLLSLSSVCSFGQKVSSAVSLLEEGRSEWQEFCINVTSHRIEDIQKLMENAVNQLVEEKKSAECCEALLILGEVYAKNFIFFDDASVCAKSVMEIQTDKRHRDNMIAKAQLANLLMWKNPVESDRLMLSLDAEAITQLSDSSDLLELILISANAAYLNNDFTSAFQYFSILQQLDYTQMDDYSVVVLLQGLSTYSLYLFQRGSIDEALSLINTCFEITVKRELTLSTASLSIQKTMGYFFYRLGMYEEAWETLQAPLDISIDHLGVSSVQSINILQIAAETLAKKGNSDEAVSMLSSVLEMLESFSETPTYANIQILSSLGISYSVQNKYKDAADAFLKASIIARRLALFNPVLHANVAMSLHEAGKENEAVIACMETMNDLREYFHQRFLSLSEQSREIYWSTEGFNIINMLSYAAASPFDTLGALFNVALLSKGILMESSTQFLRYARSSSNPDFQEVWGSYNQTRRQIENAYMDTPPDSMKIERLKSHLLTLESHLMFYGRESVRGYLSSYDCTWQDVESKLETDAVAIEFVRHIDYRDGKHYYTASVLQKGFAPVNILLSELDEEAVQNALFADIYQSDYLYRTIIKPIEQILKNKRIIYFSPVGILNAIALESIPTDSGSVLGEDYRMCRLTSTRQLVSKASLSKWESAVLYGGLDYNLGQEEIEYYSSKATEMRGVGRGLHDWPFLQGTLDEVMSIAPLLGDIDRRVITGGEGVEESFKILSGKGVNIIHVATHGYYDSQSVMDREKEGMQQEDAAMLCSGLVFSGANIKGNLSGERDDGLLSASEIANMDLQGCKLIVLSACETGKGLTSSSNEFYGLMRALKKSGCKSILMTLWEVDDRCSQRFMQAFYQALMSGSLPEEALSSAKTAVKAEYPDPHFWAPFILID